MGWSVAHPTYIFTASHKKSYLPSLPILPNADTDTNKKTDKKTIVVILTLLTTMIFTQKTQAHKRSRFHIHCFGGGGLLLLLLLLRPKPKKNISAHRSFPHFHPREKRKLNSWRKESLGDPGEVAMSLYSGVRLFSN